MIAMFVLFVIPVAFLLWVLIHAFSKFWRKVGFFWTYGVLSVPAGATIAGIVAMRDALLRIDFGTSIVNLILSAICAIGAVVLSRQCRKQLTFAILAGMPELNVRAYPGILLTEGIYAKIRHPRYIGISLWLLGCILFANYLMPYVFFVIGIPGMYALVFLEERELRERFGTQYDAYCRRVPRFVPKVR